GKAARRVGKAVRKPSLRTEKLLLSSEGKEGGLIVLALHIVSPLSLAGRAY
uniref:Uncharacterized protein n=1 Tax=Amphimedon queenslandica TaxID=400682 RepID=A0A1X7VIM4_AMPQE